MTARADQRWYTARRGADLGTVAHLCRATLRAQRDRVDVLQVDVCSDEPWPDEVGWAVRELDARRHARRRRWAVWRGAEPSISLTLDPRDDHDVELVLAVAPFTVGGDGLSFGSGALVWSVSDTGTSLAFELLPAELTVVRASLREGGHDPDDLVALDVRTPRQRRRDLRRERRDAV